MNKKQIIQGNHSIFLLTLLFMVFINSFLSAKNFIPLEISVDFRKIVFAFFFINFIWIVSKNIICGIKIPIKILTSFIILFCFAFYVITIYFLKNITYDLNEILNLLSWLVIPTLFYYYGIPNNKKIFSIIIFLFVVLYFILYFVFVINSKVFIWNNPELVNSIYYITAIIPLLLFFENRYLKIIALIMIILITILSMKSAALVILIISFLFYLININNKKNNYLKRIGIIISLFLLVVLVLSIIDKQFNVNIIDTLMANFNDGGNGRIDMWKKDINHILQGKILEKTFGFGFDTSSKLFGLSTHNDFIGVIFDFGIVGFILFTCCL